MFFVVTLFVLRMTPIKCIKIGHCIVPLSVMNYLKMVLG